jgi:hypothetical protein
MAMSPQQTQFFLELLRGIIALVQISPNLKANYASSAEKMQQFLNEGRDPTEAEFQAIRDKNEALLAELLR